MSVYFLRHYKFLLVCLFFKEINMVCSETKYE